MSKKNETHKRQRVAGKRRYRVLLNIVHLFSLLMLLAAVDAAVVSQRIAPFYGWIRDTPVETAGAYIIALVNRQDLFWRRMMRQLPLFREEDDARGVLVSRILDTCPTHLVATADGSTRFGRLTLFSKDGSSWRFSVNEGGAWIDSVLEPGDILWKQRVDLPPVELSPRDVRFLLQHATFDHYYLPPYIFAADVPFEQVYLAWTVLSELNDEFYFHFQSVVRKYKEEISYVCVYKNEEDYLRTALLRSHVKLEQSCGFYSPVEECLHVYDRTNSFVRYQLENRISEVIEAGRYADNESVRQSIATMAEDTQAKLMNYLRRDLVRTIRHEGAHQLASRYEVHSQEGVENAWLTEGLAQYCETVPIGADHLENMQVLVAAESRNGLIAWQDIVDVPASDGFSCFGDRAHLAYAQSWFMVYYLMHSPRKELFFDYIRSTRAIKPTALGRPGQWLISEALGIELLRLGWEMNAAIRAAAERVAAD